MEYTVLDEHGEASGSLEMAVCKDYAALSRAMSFDWMPDGFHFFERQLPTNDIFPIAVLEWLETNDRKRRHGIGISALRAFRMVAEEHGACLGLLRVGTGGVAEDDDLESAVRWRQRFYERDLWVRFENPPSEGLVIFWMYNLLRPIQPGERALRSRLIEKPPKDYSFGFSQPIPISEAFAPTSDQKAAIPPSD